MDSPSSRAFTRRRLGILASALCLFPRRSDAFQADGTIRIGLMESQTGLYAAYGLPGVWGSQIALDEINAAGGVTVAGKKVRLAFVPSPDGYDDAGEPSLGIAPIIVDRIFAALQGIRGRGVTILLVEQNANLALAAADRGYVLDIGRVIAGGAANMLLADDQVRRTYLGL